MKLALSEKVKPWLVLLALCALLPVRRLDAFTNPQFWAEDFIFLLDAQNQGAESFLSPRAGYLHAIPRTIAYIGSFLDPCLQPPAYVALSVLTLLAIAGSALSARLELPGKAWLAAAIVIVPHSGEVFFNPTNAQWIAALGLLLTVLKCDPERTSDWMVDTLLLVFSGLSGPFILIAAPLFSVRAFLRRTRASVLLAMGVLTLASLQLWFVLHSPADTEFTGPFSPHGLAANFTFRLPFSLFFGALAEASVPTGAWVSISVGAIVIGFVACAVSSAPRFRNELLYAAAFALGIVLMTALRKRIDVWGFGDLANGDRYWYIPKVVLLWLVGLIFLVHDRTWMRWTAFSLAASSVVLNYNHFIFPAYTDHHWYEKCPEIRRGAEVEVTINPGWNLKYTRPAEKPSD